MRNYTIEFFLCLFFGYFGVHRFYRKQKGIGFVYLFTLGIFGLGWLVDSIILLVKVIEQTKKPVPQKVTASAQRTSSSVLSSPSPAPTPEQLESRKRLEEEEMKILDYNRKILRTRKPIGVFSLTKVKKYDSLSSVEAGDQVEIITDYDDNADPFYVVSNGGSEIGEISRSTVEKFEDQGIDDIEDRFCLVSEVDEYEGKCRIAVFDENIEYNDEGYCLLVTEIRGVKYDNDDGTSRQEYLSHMEDGDKLFFIAVEFEGKPAVQVRNLSGQTLGYLKKELSEEFSKKINGNKIGNVYLINKHPYQSIIYADMAINFIV